MSQDLWRYSDQERHRHRYEFNPEFRSILEEKGLKAGGVSPDGKLVEMVEYSEHPWFIGCQFHPEFKSKPMDSHPLFASYIRACLEYKLASQKTQRIQGRIKIESQGLSWSVIILVSVSDGV